MLDKTKGEKILERTNTPILVLAAVAVVLYVLELFRVIPKSLLHPFQWINFTIDLIFLIDLLAKSLVLGRRYLRSPWFFIDLVSTLPIISSALELLGNVGPQLQVTRVARGARVARIARVARAARLAKVARVARLATAIRATHGLNFLKSDVVSPETPNFDRALFVGVPLLLVAFVTATSLITRAEVDGLQKHLDQLIESAESVEDLESVRRDYDLADALHPNIEVYLVETGLPNEQQIALSLEKAYAKADRIAGIMLLLILLTIATSAYISNALATDRGKGRVRSILSQCFSPPIVNKFYQAPEVIERFYNQWMTVFFIDIRGFTKASEKDADDVEGLALRLRKVMDTARKQIVVTHEGVIDKFMGDAVMGWVGGHFSIHWRLLDELRHRLRMDKLELVNQDIKSLKRELRSLGDLDQVKSSSQTQLESALDEAQLTKSKLISEQKAEIERDEDLMEKFKEVTKEYRRRVAKTAVICCLRIWEEVERQKEPEAFNQLKIGVGSGPVLVGNFGSTDQIGFTVLGPTVNRAARLEPASAQCGCRILVDDNTYQLLKTEANLLFRRVPMIAVKGVREALIAYEPFFADQVSMEFLSAFEMGVNAVGKGELKEAIDCFTRSDSLFVNGDAASKIWMRECQLALSEGRSIGVKAVSK